MRPVRLSSLAALDLQEARDGFDRREAGLGDRFLESVERTLERISTNANQYQVALLDLHRAPIRPFEYSLWYRVLPDESIVTLVAHPLPRKSLFFRVTGGKRPPAPAAGLSMPASHAPGAHVAALSDRRDLSLARRRALRIEPTQS
jgi:hypothetical protein